MLFFTLYGLFAAENWSQFLCELKQNPIEYLRRNMASKDSVKQEAVNSHLDFVQGEIIDISLQDGREQTVEFLHKLERAKFTQIAHGGSNDNEACMTVTEYIWTTVTAICLAEKVATMPDSSIADFRPLTIALSHLSNNHAEYRDHARYFLLTKGKESGDSASCFDYAVILQSICLFDEPPDWFRKERSTALLEAFCVIHSTKLEDRARIPDFYEACALCLFRLLHTTPLDPDRYTDIVLEILKLLNQFVNTQKIASPETWQASAKNIQSTEKLRTAVRTKHVPENNSVERLVYSLELASRFSDNHTDPEVKRDLCFAADAIGDVNFDPQILIVTRWMSASLYKISADRQDGGPAACSKYAGALIVLYQEYPYYMWASPEDWHKEALHYAELSLQRLCAQLSGKYIKEQAENQRDYLKRVTTALSKQEQQEIKFFYYILDEVSKIKIKP